MRDADLKAVITTAPRTPGVYFWRTRTGKPLYIGKAANLRSRLSSYLKASNPRIQAMVKDAVSLDWQETGTDIEALILESHLIKKERPKYNIDWRDDKQYFYVGFTKEPFPHIFLSHQLSEKKADFVGPFTEGAPLKTTLRFLRRLFPYCTCKQKHYVRCLNAHIGNCPGFCCLRDEPTREQLAAYRKNIRAIRDLLTGKHDLLIRRIEREMKKLGSEGNLDEALATQKTLEKVRRVFQNAQVNARRTRSAVRHFGALDQLEQELSLIGPPLRIEGYDTAVFQGSHPVGSMVVFTEGVADRAQYRLFNIATPEGGDTAMLREVVRRRMKHAEWPRPDLILVDGGKAQQNAVQRVLGSKDRSIPVLALTKNDRHQADHIITHTGNVRPLSDIPRQMRDLLVHVDAEAHRFAISHYRRRHRRSLVR